MARYTVRRLAAAVPLFIGITALCFALLHASPGGPLAGVDVRRTGADLERLERVLGLDAPLPLQYARWFGRLVRGDLGTSLVTGQPVAHMIRQRLPATLELMAVSLLLSLVIGIATGVVAALRRGSAVDRILGVVTLAGLSMPVFWLGVLSLLYFSAHLGWLPSGGRGTLGMRFDLVDHLRHLVLPAVVLAAVQVPLWSRHARSSLLEVLSEDFLRAARARGLSERRVIWRHALRPALLPVVTLVGLQVPALFTGTVITETIFSWPGVGRLFFEGVQRFDYTRLMGILALATGLVIVCNLAADLVQARMDPRVRLGART